MRNPEALQWRRNGFTKKLGFRETKGRLCYYVKLKTQLVHNIDPSAVVKIGTNSGNLI